MPEAYANSGLPERSISRRERLRVPDETCKVVFYPFEGDELLSEDELLRRFPATWQYLESHRGELEARRAVRENPESWWRPERPRKPSKMLRPKIVTPHLVLFPRFALDIDGRYAVSRAPILYAPGAQDDVALLKYIMAVLNSRVGHWQIATQSHKYDRGYARLEGITLRNCAMPNPASVPPRLMNTIQRLTDDLIENPQDVDSERQLDELVCELYGLQMNELEEISFGYAE